MRVIAGERPGVRPGMSSGAVPRLLVVFGGTAALAVATLSVLATNSWWALVFTVVVVLAGFGAVTATVLASLDEKEKEKEDPVTAARLESEERRRIRSPA